MAEADWSNLIVEVLHNQGDDTHPNWSVGSGFFIGPKLVLTALHNVDGPGELLVRVHGTEEYPAVVLLVGEEDIVDLAALEVSDVEVDVPPLRYGAVDRSTSTVLEGCWAVGFPRFKERAHHPKPLRLSAQVNGEIPTSENLDQRLLTLLVRRSPRLLPSSAVHESEWSGMSGAMVFSGNNIIVGVITEHHLPEGESALTVVPIIALDLLPEAEATKWWKLLGVDQQALVRLPVKAAASLSHVTLHQLFASLTDGLMGLPGSPLNGVEQFLREYLGTPEVPAPFGGRQVQLAELDRWLATPGQPYALLVAEAGRGKSALLAQWVARVADERRADVAFVPISIRFGTSLKSTAVSLLGKRLRHLHGVSADLPRDAETWLAEINQYLREDHHISSPLLIVLDGADEAADWTMGRDLRFPPQPGREVKVLVSARPLADCDAVGWLRRLEWQWVVLPMELPLLDRSGVAEVLRSMGDPLARLVTQVDAVGELHRLSEGDPLLVRLYVDALRGTGEHAAFLTPEDLGHLKPGLEAYFDQWWDDQRHQWGPSVPLKEPAVRTLLNLLACALGPLSTDDLLVLMEPEQVDLWILEEALQPLARFVVSDDNKQGYVFSHPRLNQYFYEKLSPRERRAWENRFMSYGRQTLVALTSGELDPCEVSRYPVRYYGAHLERAGADPGLFHELVCEGWQRAWEALEGSYDGFLSDLARAWKRAEAAGAQAQSTEDRGQAIGRQCRYALIVASIKSQAGNIPPALLAALVDRGVWTPIQGLASVRQIPDDKRRAAALVALAPHLPKSLLPEALAAARMIADENSRARALTALAPHLSEPLLQEALEAVRAIENESLRAAVLRVLIPQVSESLLQEALATARAIRDESRRARALRALAPQVFEPFPQNVLVAEHTYETWQVQAPPALAPQVSEPLLSEALAAARAFGEGDSRRAEALRALAPHLAEPLREAVLQEALAAARAIAYADSRARALTALAPQLSEPLQETMLREALAAVQAIADENNRAQALTALAPQLSEPLLQEALAAARAIVNEPNRVQALTALAAQLSEPLQETVLQEALAVVQAIPYWEGYRRDQALTALAPYLSAEPLLQEALAAARAMKFDGNRVQVLTALAAQLSEPLQETVLREALAAVQAIGDKIWRVQALTALVPHLSEPLQREALAALQAIADENSRDQVLTALAPHLSEPLLREALAAVQAIADENSRAEALTALALQLSEPLRETVLREALAAARAIADENSRAEALTALASHLSEPLRETVLREALAAARAIADENSRVQVLRALTSHPSEPLRQEALAAMWAIPDWDRRGQALATPRTSVWQMSHYEVWRADPLYLKHTPHLSEPLLQGKLTEALAFGDAYIRADALAQLAPRLSEPLAQEALAAARAFEDAKSRAQTLTALAPQLSEPLRETVLQEALAAARAIADKGARAHALAGLAPYMKQLPVVRLYSLWSQTLHTLAIRTRSDLLSDIQALIPLTVALGEKEVLVATMQAIIEVGKWFP